MKSVNHLSSWESNRDHSASLFLSGSLQSEEETIQQGDSEMKIISGAKEEDEGSDTEKINERRRTFKWGSHLGCRSFDVPSVEEGGGASLIVR